MRVCMLLLFGFLASAVAAQEKPNAPLTLKGQVVDAAGKPVAGATVDLRTDDVGMEKPSDDLREKDDLLATLKSDAQGDFAFKDVALPAVVGRRARAGTLWRVLARAPEHGIGWLHVNYSQKDQEPAVIKLSRPATVRGQVTDAQMKPLANALVRVVGLNLLEPPGVASPIRSAGYLPLQRTRGVFEARTDADGRVVLSDLPADARIDIRITDKNHVVDGVYVATTKQPQPHLVQRGVGIDGQVKTVEAPVHNESFMVNLKPGYCVTGQVVFADSDKPVGLVWVSFRHESGQNFPERTDAEGRFRRGQLPAGKYTFSAGAPEKSDYIAGTGNFELSDKTPEVAHDCKLPRGVVVTGKVVDEETGAGIKGVSVFLEQGSKPGLHDPVVTEADGSFRFAIPPGDGTLRIAGRIPGYVLPMQPIYRTGKEPASDNPHAHALSAKHDAPPPAITFKLGKGLTLSGQVVDEDGKPVAGAKLWKLDNYSVRWDAPLATTDADGKFTLSGLDQRVKSQMIVLHEQRRLAAFHTSKAKKDQKRVDDVRIRVEPQATMTGRVVDDEKQPVAGAKIYAYIQIQMEEEEGRAYITSFSPFTDKPSQTDKDGKFVCDRLIPGLPHQASVYQEGYAGSFAAQFIPKGGEKHAVGDLLLVKADQTVAGSVIDPAGRPLAGIRVYANSRSGGLAYVSSEQVHTDKDGRFKIGKLPKGKVELSALSEADEQGISMSNQVIAHTGKEDVRIVLFLRRKAPAPEALLGKPAPEFPIGKWLRGGPASAQQAFKSADFQGKVVVLAYVDEAKPSQRVLPLLQALQERHGGSGLQVLRVHEFGDEEDLVKLSTLPAALVSSGLVPVGFSDAFQKYGVRATPTLFVIDKQGVLRAVDAKVEELEGVVKKLLEG